MKLVNCALGCMLCLLVGVAASPFLQPATSVMKQAISNLRSANTFGVEDACTLGVKVAALASCTAMKSLNVTQMFATFEREDIDIFSKFDENNLADMCGGCLQALAVALNNPLCTADQKKMGTMLSGMMCVKSDNKFCFPFQAKLTAVLDSTGFPNPLNMSNEHVELFCHPCTASFLQTASAFSDKNDTKNLIVMSRLLTSICVTDSTGAQCITKMRESEAGFLDKYTGDAIRAAPTTAERVAIAAHGAQILHKMCSTSCTRRVYASIFRAFNTLAHGTPLQAQVNQEMAKSSFLLDLACVPVPANSKFCGEVLVETEALLPEACPGPVAWQVTPPSQEAIRMCVNNYTSYVANVGCCMAELFQVNQAARQYLPAPLLSGSSNATCVQRVQRLLKRLIFSNIKYSYYLDHKAEVEERIIADIAASYGVAARHVKITVTSTGTATSSLRATAAAPAGVAVDATVECTNAAECTDGDAQLVASLTKPETFAALQSLPLEASVDPTVSPVVGVSQTDATTNPTGDKSAATGRSANMVMAVVAVFAAAVALL